MPTSIDIKKNLSYALRSLVSADILGLIALQFIVLIVSFIVLAISLTGVLANALYYAFENIAWLAAIKNALANIYLGFAIDSAIYLTSLLLIFLTAVVLTQIILSLFFDSMVIRHVIKKRFPHLERTPDTSFWNEVLFNIKNGLIWLFLLIIGIPLLFMGPVYTIWTFLVTAYFLKTNIPYSALCELATKKEMEQLEDDQSRPLWHVGLACSAIAYIPFIGFLFPAFSLLWFTHCSLEALDQQRRDTAQKTV